MGRQANALDWTERTDQGSGSGLRAFPVIEPERCDSEIRVRAEEPAVQVPPGETANIDDDGPTRPFHRVSSVNAQETMDPLCARGIARLSALGDWLEVEDPSGPVVELVRMFLRDLGDITSTLEALACAARDPSVPPGLGSTIGSLVHAVGTWRTNLVGQVDDLALTEHRSFSGWSSLPKYSSAYTLALVQPALADAEAWAIATRNEASEEVDLVARVGAVAASVRRLNATLRIAIEETA
jgi:hypothetical protein